MLWSVTLVVVSLTGLQMVALVSSFEELGQPPALFHSLAEVPLAAFFVVWSVLGAVLAGLVVSVFGDTAFGFLYRVGQSNLSFYFLAAVFFGAFNALVFLPLVLYLRKRSSILPYLFTALITIYASLVVGLSL